MTAPKRRRLKIALAVFVVLTLFGCALGWQVHIVRQRRAILDRLAGGVGIVQPVPEISDVSIPFWRTWLGDEPMLCLVLPVDQFSKADLEHVRWLFPEADIARAKIDRKNWLDSELIED